MRITITDTRTGKKTVLQNPHGLKIEVEVAEGGEVLHGIEMNITGGCLTVFGKDCALKVTGEPPYPWLVLTAEALVGAVNAERLG